MDEPQSDRSRTADNLAPQDPAKPATHLLVQAPVPALDVDGLVLVVIGTSAFALASVVALLVRGDLEAAGRGWWVGVCVSGFALGLIGLAYCWHRRRGRQANASAP